jgi:hypothetical protein
MTKLKGAYLFNGMLFDGVGYLVNGTKIEEAFHYENGIKTEPSREELNLKLDSLNMLCNRIGEDGVLLDRCTLENNKYCGLFYTFSEGTCIQLVVYTNGLALREVEWNKEGELVYSETIDNDLEEILCKAGSGTLTSYSLSNVNGFAYFNLNFDSYTKKLSTIVLREFTFSSLSQFQQRFQMEGLGTFFMFKGIDFCETLNLTGSTVDDEFVASLAALYQFNETSLINLYDTSISVSGLVELSKNLNIKGVQVRPKKDQFSSFDSIDKSIVDCPFSILKPTNDFF